MKFLLPMLLAVDGGVVMFTSAPDLYRYWRPPHDVEMIPISCYNKATPYVEVSDAGVAWLICDATGRKP